MSESEFDPGRLMVLSDEDIGPMSDDDIYTIADFARLSYEQVRGIVRMTEWRLGVQSNGERERMKNDMAMLAEQRDEARRKLDEHLKAEAEKAYQEKEATR